MTNKLEYLSYLLASAAGLCLISGLLVLTGGELEHGDIGDGYVSD